jgi:hypothetical protein
MLEAVKRAALLVLALVAACTSSSPTAVPSPSPSTPSPTPAPSPTYAVTVVPADFTADVTNPWFPLPPGRVLEYRGVQEDGPVRELLTVSDETEKVDGVTCRVVLDRLYLDGVLSETTKDFYAQDRQGAVWYFGEDTAELDEDGSMVTTEGTFHAGVTGSLPGILMSAVPKVGESHRQEYLPGYAEDFYAVELLSTSVTTPYRAFRTGVLRAREWTPLEAGVVSKKWYVRGIGVVREANTTGPKEELSLVRVSSD